VPTTLFISDLHLQPERPDIATAFVALLRGRALNSEALYILGDLFEYWIGDKAMDDFQETMVQTLRQYSATGRKLYFVPGNRDFLTSALFEKKTGCRILPDPTVINLYDQPTVILHGDTLCLEDTDYLAFRKKIRHPLILLLARIVPAWLLKYIAGRIREASKQATRMKPDTSLDVTPAEAVRVMRHLGVKRMIHGHTHRPATHQEGAPDYPCQRIVLGDWDKTGCLLEVSESRSDLLKFPIDQSPDLAH
jgi:UDP-2,3-diacylglucosamine hydrolase